MAKKKKITIHKRNEIVRGADLYSLNAKRCFNAIYYLYQKNRELFAKYEEKGVSYMSIKFSTLRNLMSLEKDNNYVEIIKEAIRELQTTLIELNNWTNPVTGKKYLWYSTKFLNDAHISKDNNIAVSLEISTLFKELMIDQKNFTPLNLIEYMNKFRTKYAMKLYEYLKSFGGYKYIDISQKHLLKLLGLPEDHKTYKYYYELKRVIERQLKEIANKTDLKEVKLLNYKSLAKEKIFRIIINPKASKKTAKPKEIEDVLNAMIKRF
jgi:peptidyl-tRNA hydrolase